MKPAMGVCPKDSKLSALLREMDVQEGLVGVAFREVSCSGQFMGNFHYRWQGVILFDDGLVQWHAVQTGSHFSH